jgi:hypothetical protein
VRYQYLKRQKDGTIEEINMESANRNLKPKEGNMKRKAMIAIVGTLLVVFGGAMAGMCGETEDASLSKIYGAFVDNYIQKCEAKAEMLDSGSLNIRQGAIRATVKGAFIESNRTTMIKYLMAENTPLNADRIEYHLNQKYAESVYPQEVYALLLKEHVDQ